MCLAMVVILTVCITSIKYCRVFDTVFKMVSSIRFFVCVQLLYSCIPVSSTTSAGSHKSKVLILGAGMSGLKAADALQSQGIRDFILLEGSNRIGGRVLSAKLKGGQTVNLGVNWIQVLDGAAGKNPVWTLAKRCNLSTKTSDFDDNVYFIEKNATFLNDS